MKLPPDLPELLRPELQRHWQQYCAAAPPQDVELLRQSAVFAGLPKAWACSPFIAKLCIAHPAWLRFLLDRGDLLASYGAESYAQRLQATLQGAETEEDFFRLLRQFRQREMLRIAWRDLAELAEITESFRDLSALADAALQAALQRYDAELRRRYGTPRDASGAAQDLVILAMGKLGGGELNFSSDIDLIFAYPEGGETDGERGLDNREFFVKLGQKVIAAINTTTADGFVFRVDMRLRPFGDSGPLAVSFDAFEEYCQAHGREWERYALIKARPVTGQAEPLMAALRPFVYRRYLDFGAFESIRNLKQQIDQESRRLGRDHDIKLGIGGIREIEFTCQALQLLRGGRQPALQNRSLLETLDILQNYRYLPAQATSDLLEAYLFLRQAEHRIQQIADEQTQRLPQDEIDRARLAYAMRFPHWEAFIAGLHRHQQRVHGYYNQLIVGERVDNAASQFQALWADLQPENPALASFSQPAEALKLLRDLKHSQAALAGKGKERLDQLMPLLLQEIAGQPQPDTVLPRLLKLIDAVARRSVYLALLIDHPAALKRVARLFAQSAWIAGQIARYPILLDEVLNPRLDHHLNVQELGKLLQNQLAHLPADDLEAQMDTLRHFKRGQILRVAAAELSGQIEACAAGEYLGAIAASVLRQALPLAWQYLAKNHGQPHCRDNGIVRPAGFCIIAYGKAGSEDMNFGSDLDLVFLHNSRGEEQMTDGAKPLDNSTFFARLARRIIHILTTPTAAGVLYETDSRLRPQGNSGLMVSSMEAFREYQRQNAWTWEHQALLRARPIAGDAACCAEFSAIRLEVLSQSRDPEALRRAVAEMRQKMRASLDSSNAAEFDLKQGQGGLVDIEFLAQFGALSHAADCPALLQTTRLLPLLYILRDCGFFSETAAQNLETAYHAYHAEIHRLALQELPAKVAAGELLELRGAVERFWREMVE